jgi:hypothetical protein
MVTCGWILASVVSLSAAVTKSGCRRRALLQVQELLWTRAARWCVGGALVNVRQAALNVFAHATRLELETRTLTALADHRVARQNALEFFVLLANDVDHSNETQNFALYYTNNARKWNDST